MIKEGGSTRDAVFLIADIFGLAYPMNYNCYEGFEEAKEVLLSYAKIFDSPLNIFFHLVYNFGRVYDDLARAVSAAQGGDAALLGKSVGDVAYILFFIK